MKNVVVKVARFYVKDIQFGMNYHYFGIFKDTNELNNFITENKQDGNEIDILRLVTVLIDKDKFEYLANSLNVDAELSELLYNN